MSFLTSLTKAYSRGAKIVEERRAHFIAIDRTIGQRKSFPPI